MAKYIYRPKNKSNHIGPPEIHTSKKWDTSIRYDRQGIISTKKVIATEIMKEKDKTQHSTTFKVKGYRTKNTLFKSEQSNAMI